MDTISKERRDAAKALIREALRFADWAAGEGIAPADGQPATAPDEFLAAYSDATGDDDWDALADRLPALLDALDAEGEPVAVKPLEWSQSRVFGHQKRRGSGVFGEFYSFDAENMSKEQIAAEEAKCQTAYEARIRSALYTRPTIPPGFRLVPVEPTDEMLDAAIDEADWRVEVPGADAEAVSVAEQMNNMAKTAMASTYRAMLSAAPEAK